MNSGKETVSLEVRSPGGELLFVLVLNGLELSPQRGKRAAVPTNGSGKPSPEPNNGARAAEPMTDAQKRYLFRILADQDIEGDDASEHLKNLFQVESLKEVTKQEASRAIEQLLEKSKGGKGNGSPVKQSN